MIPQYDHISLEVVVVEPVELFVVTMCIFLALEDLSTLGSTDVSSVLC